MNGKLNTQNVRQYAPKGHPPAFNFDKSSNRDKLTVWAGLCSNGLIFRPCFFEENVNGRAYLCMLNDFVHNLFSNFDDKKDRMYILPNPLQISSKYG